MTNPPIPQTQKGRAGSCSLSLFVNRESALLAGEMKIHMEKVKKKDKIGMDILGSENGSSGGSFNTAYKKYY